MPNLESTMKEIFIVLKTGFLSKRKITFQINPKVVEKGTILTMKAMRSKPVEEERFEGVFGDTQNSVKFSKSNQLTNIPKWLFFWTICWISQNKL